MRYYVDDGILVGVQWWPDGRRCLRAVQSLASDHFRLLGERGVSDPPLLSARKITYWDTQLEVLGWIIDTEALTVTLPSHESLKLQNLLAEWPSSRTSDSARQVSQLLGFLIHASFAVRPGRLFVNRLLASVGMPRLSAGADFGFRTANPGRRLVLGPKFQGDSGAEEYPREKHEQTKAGTRIDHSWRNSCLYQKHLKVKPGVSLPCARTLLVHTSHYSCLRKPTIIPRAA